MAREERKRNWAFTVYADSAPCDWKERLAKEVVPAFISPIHDRDTTEDGELKKPHWHVMLMYSGLRPIEHVRELCLRVGAANGYVEPVVDSRAYARYLCHLDNQDKARYDPSDVVQLGGADYREKTGSALDVDTAVGEMMDWCDENGCVSFATLSRYARRNRPDWFRVLTSSRTVFMSAFVRSLKWEADCEKRN